MRDYHQFFYHNLYEGDTRRDLKIVIEEWNELTKAGVIVRYEVGIGRFSQSDWNLVNTGLGWRSNYILDYTEILFASKEEAMKFRLIYL